MATAKIRNNYLDENQNRFIEQLSEWLAIPSISTLSEHKDDVGKAADWVNNRLAAIGFPESKTISTEGHPLVFAEWHVDDNQPTMLIYGHYDVQPVDPIEEWQSPPFQPTIRDGNIYCRGASDDKAQIMLILAALEAWVKVDSGLPVNIKILLEGEEEAGGASIAGYVQENPDLLRADAVLICDTHMVDSEQPSLVTGLRGVLYTEITVSGAKTDLHSGSYGGVAPNPIHALCVLISRLKGEDGIIQIPELAAAIPTPSAAEKLFWQEDPLHIEEALRTEMGVAELVGEKNYPPLERIGVRPTFEVHGIRGGFTAEGAKTVIPATAMAKISYASRQISTQTRHLAGWRRRYINICRQDIVSGSPICMPEKVFIFTPTTAQSGRPPTPSNRYTAGRRYLCVKAVQFPLLHSLMRF
jgi:acetylornithine deacetylase/succinyl-diaminopimelate desuccinylase-like protein